MASMVHHIQRIAARIVRYLSRLEQYGAAIYDRVSMSSKVSARFTAFGGMMQGRNLMMVPYQMIVQAGARSHGRRVIPTRS
jgi:hypothetical protein